VSTVVQNFPSANAVHDDIGWGNPQQAYSDDGLYATIAPAQNGTESNDWTGFGFTIPSTATIDKVEIIYQFKVSVTTSIATISVAYITSTGTHLTAHTDATEPTSDKTVTLDVTADSGSWTPTELNSANQGVHAAAIRGNSKTAVTFSLDYVSIQVTYTEAGTRRRVMVID
jgi:hypothetical protein